MNTYIIFDGLLQKTILIITLIHYLILFKLSSRIQGFKIIKNKDVVDDDGEVRQGGLEFWREDEEEKEKEKEITLIYWEEDIEI